ncbi:hypothetical protein KZ483_13235 [Paenibacillus sp. sptzw28]|uniref:hypothetical protein n=1 Tax=Paenibacillus sp. sptzw28 TaxID=715179 RepID=UPI001C6F41AC|nr:hypothetical protein [Paenibacillus sp. sptzw28]QYR23764.1 hypothetical protein KZ483_13235 [Paenibacillus sp. sptzw28]
MVELLASIQYILLKSEEEDFNVIRFRFKPAAAIALAVSISLMTVGLAYAASNNAISGTVYAGCSGNGPWYVSSIARTKAGTGEIKAQFSAINDGGLTFKLQDASNVQIGNVQSWGKNETGIWRVFSSSVSSGKVFYNAFRDTTYACPDNQTNYNFTGTEYY